MTTGGQILSLFWLHAHLEPTYNISNRCVFGSLTLLQKSTIQVLTMEKLPCTFSLKNLLHSGKKKVEWIRRIPSHGVAA